MLERKTLGSTIFNVFNYTFLAAFALFCLFPFWIMVVASFTDSLVLRQDGYLPWAREWSLEAYRWVLAGRGVQIRYRTTIFVTLVGTTSSIIVIGCLGYVLLKVGTAG